MKEFGQKLKELRLYEGLSQKGLGDIMNVSRTTIHSWERDKQEPDLGTIKFLADYFDVPSDLLLGLEDERLEHNLSVSKYTAARLNQNEYELVSQFRLLSKDKQDALLKLIK